MDDFRKYATKHLGMNGMVFDDVIKSQAGYLNPYILEERQLNVTQLDVFSRLMMDRIIFLGTQVDDYTANTLQAQLLYLDSVDPGKDISIYINSPGGSVYAGLGIYDTMQFISSDVATICTGMAASMAAVLLVAGAEGKRSALPHSRVMIHQPMGSRNWAVGNRKRPLLSVFKFFIAVQTLRQMEQTETVLNAKLTVKENMTDANMYSPMLKKHPRRPFEISLAELLEYMIAESDNNAADILLEYSGGTGQLEKFLHDLGFSGIDIRVNEKQMNQKAENQYPPITSFR